MSRFFVAGLSYYPGVLHLTHILAQEYDSKLKSNLIVYTVYNKEQVQTLKLQLCTLPISSAEAVVSDKIYCAGGICVEMKL